MSGQLGNLNAVPVGLALARADPPMNDRWVCGILPADLHEIGNHWRGYFQEHAYHHDALEMAARSNFFLRVIVQYVSIHRNPVVLHLGSGWTTYPFFFGDDIHWIEVDHMEVAARRRSALESAYRIAAIPRRNIEVVGVDLSHMHSIVSILSQVARRDATPILVLAEGLSYYLPEEAWLHIEQEISRRKAWLAFDYWARDATASPVTKRVWRSVTGRKMSAVSSPSLLSHACRLGRYTRLDWALGPALAEALWPEEVAATHDRWLPEWYVAYTPCPERDPVDSDPSCTLSSQQNG